MNTFEFNEDPKEPTQGSLWLDEDGNLAIIARLGTSENEFVAISLADGNRYSNSGPLSGVLTIGKFQPIRKGTTINFTVGC